MRQPLADLLIFAARPWSDGAPVAAADAIAVRDGRVLGLGRESELEPLVGPRTLRLDAGGATVTPGLADAHIHLVSWARAQTELDLSGCASRAEAIERLDAFLARHPELDPVMGRGWQADAWSEPVERAPLDRVSGGRVVLLHGKDFHSLWVNSAALRRAGIARDTPDPTGGRIERDAAGEPTGVFREHAVRLFAGLEPPRGPAEDLTRVRAAARALLAEGVTMVHVFEGAEEQRVLRSLVRDGGPWLRVLMHLRHEALDHARALGIASGLGDDRFRIGAIKLFADGTLGSRTAALLEPYDGTTDRGMELLSPAALTEAVRRAAESGLAIAIHAIGDRAVRHALDACAAAGDTLRRAPLPSRIEHVQLLDPQDLPRFSRLGLFASMQPLHCTADFELASRWWSKRLDRAYPWRSLLASGARLAFGSDAPVEPPSVAAGLAAAVTRRRADGNPAGGFVPEQRIGLDDALRAYTEGPARLAGAWPRLGRIAEGSAADLVVWDRDLHAQEPSGLAASRPRWTLLEGDVVHDRGMPETAAPALSVAPGGAP